MVLKSYRKMIRRIKRISSVSLVMLCSLLLILSISPIEAYAAITTYNAVDYVSGTTVSGDTKTVTYTFADGELALSSIYVDDVSQGTAKGAFSYEPPNDNVSKVSVTTFFMGVVNYVNSSARGGIIDISDIMSGATLSISAQYKIIHQAYSSLEDFDLNLRYRAVAYCYDENYNYLSAVYTSWTSAVTTKETIDIIADITVPSDVVYFCPSIQVIWSYSDAPIDSYLFTVVPYGFSFSCDINMIYEQSQTMEKIEQQLGDIGGKLDNTNDKLDAIISGGEAGDELGAAGDRLDDASNDAAGDIGAADQFEDGMMSDAQDRLDDMDQLEIVTGVGEFSDSLQFVSGYLTDIFIGVEKWSVVITAPLFLGLVMYICSHSGGITHVVKSSNAARADSDAAAMDARRVSEMKGHISSGAHSESYYVYQETMW